MVYVHFSIVTQGRACNLERLEMTNQRAIPQVHVIWTVVEIGQNAN